MAKPRNPKLPQQPDPETAREILAEVFGTEPDYWTPRDDADDEYTEQPTPSHKVG